MWSGTDFCSCLELCVGLWKTSSHKLRMEGILFINPPCFPPSSPASFLSLASNNLVIMVINSLLSFLVDEDDYLFVLLGDSRRRNPKINPNNRTVVNIISRRWRRRVASQLSPVASKTYISHSMAAAAAAVAVAAVAVAGSGGKKERLKQAELSFQGWVAKSKLTARAKQLLNELTVSGAGQGAAADRAPADWIAIARALHAIDSTSLYSAFVTWTRACFPRYETQCQKVWQALKPRFEFRSRQDVAKQKEDYKGEDEEDEEEGKSPPATQLCFLDR